jgi:hypothetical protein
MKDLYKGIADVLQKDIDLVNMVGFTAKNMNIRRAFTPLGEWDKLVIFYGQPEYVITDFTSQIRTIPLIIRVYDRASDLNVDDITERIILLLDGADLSVAGCVYVYDCAYVGDLVATDWNDDLKTFERVVRFNVLYRMDKVVGSGLPTRKRKT